MINLGAVVVVGGGGAGDKFILLGGGRVSTVLSHRDTGVLAHSFIYSGTRVNDIF